MTGASTQKGRRFMRITTLVLGTLGGLFSAAIGMKWLSDAEEYAKELELAAQLGMDTGSLVTAAYLLLLTFVAAIVGGFYAFKGQGKLAAGILLAGGILPGLFEGRAFLPTALVIVAGLVALKIKPR
jgi:hypothetical protein